MKNFFFVICDLQKKGSSYVVFRKKVNLNSETENKCVETSVPELLGILSGVSTNQNLSGWAFTPCIPASYTTGLWSTSWKVMQVCFFNTKKAFKKLYMFYFETFRIILNPSSTMAR